MPRLQSIFFHFFILILFFTSSPANAQSAPPEYFATYEKICAGLAANAEKLSDKARLDKLFTAHWDYLMHDFPEWATDVGYPGLNHLWTDSSPEAVAKRKTMTKVVKDTLKSIDREKLTDADKLNYDLFAYDADLQIEKARFPEEVLQLTQMDGVLQDSIQTLDNMSTASVKDYKDILARMRGLPRLFDQAMAWLEIGLAKKITPPKITLKDVPRQVLEQIKDDPLQSPILQPFTRFPVGMSEADQKALSDEAVKVYTEMLKPALKKFHDFVEQKYVPGARETIAFSTVPDGEAWYALKVREETTTTLSPKQIHDIGLGEVKRIKSEMEAILKEVKYAGTLKDFADFLKSDPKFYFSKRSDLISQYRDIAKRLDPELVKLFGTLPRLPYGIKPVPRYSEKTQGTAYYMPGSLKAGRPGFFFANTYDLKSRPKWEMEALTLHETVPGHHLQIAIARELEGLPEFRKELDMTAYIEGWGLYSESLGKELGLYKDPYSRFGRLSYEMLRSIRLVVDTGMHSLGWSRDQALTFFKDNAVASDHEIEVEVDRYIVWPGQALAYKIGELKIQELRKNAKAELGDAFDIRKFHDQVLGAGPLPLDFLEREVKAWVAARR